MDWSGNLRHFVSRPADQCSYGFLYNYNYDQYQGMEMKHQGMFSEAVQQGLVSGMEMKNSNNSIAMGSSSYGSNNQDKKKRLTSDQLDSLERSFQEEIKLDPDRKMKLSRDLGLQPRQIAVWFQNRRARWKAKQLERLYDTLKQEFDVISKEKQKLQDEVRKLKAMLKDQISWKQVSTGGYTEISGGEETVESTSDAIRSSSIKSQGANHHHHQMAAADQCINIFNMEEYNTVSPPPNYWGPLPSYP